MEASIGVNLRVTAHSNQGGRKYMEDMFCVAYQPTADDRDLLYAYFGIFDGHGGREAALYAKHNLMDHIVSQKNFWSDDDELVLKAIRDGFLSTHYAMLKELEKWPKTPSGLPSTSGTTASIGFVRRGKLYIGHVGDSGIVMGYEDHETGFWRAQRLTEDHKPESPAESSRITEAGGKVIVKSGVPRVVWNRPRIGHKGPVRRSTLIDEIPFLAVARSLGDLWSYNSEQDVFVVSPEPDVSVREIDVHSHRCLILGTDGLWNMLSPQDAVNSVYFAEKNNERQPQHSQHSTDPLLSKSWINPSKRLVDRALDRWFQHSLRADNTSVVTVVVDPPGPPKDACSAPVGISRYFPQPPQSPTRSNQPVAASSSQKVPAATSVTSPSKLPSISHPRVITKTPCPSTDSSSQPVSSPTTSRAKSAKLTRSKRVKPAPKTSLPPSSSPVQTASGSTSGDLDNVASAFYPVSTRHGRDRNAATTSAAPVHDTRRHNSTISTDDVQIHEISSSSEASKTDVKSSQSIQRKRKSRKTELPTEIAQKKPRLPEGEGRLRPVTRKPTKVALKKQKSPTKVVGKKKVLTKETTAIIPTNSMEITKGKEVKEGTSRLSRSATKKTGNNSNNSVPVVATKRKLSTPIMQSKPKIVKKDTKIAKGKVIKKKSSPLKVKEPSPAKEIGTPDSERSLRSTSKGRVLRSRESKK